MADSPLGVKSRGGSSDSPQVSRTRSGPTTVRPQPVTEQSLMESVAGFINEVQAFSQPSADPKCQVTWARFEQADINDPSLYTENSFDANGNSLPLLLVLGYTQGVQVWLIPGSGEAKLVLSLFHGQVKALRILPTPTPRLNAPDLYSHVRPLVALCDSAGPGTAFMSVSFVSLLSGEQVNHIKFSSEVADICVNKRVICVAFRERVAIFDALSLRDKVTISSCYPSPGVHSNPLALHDRWLAYSDRALCLGRRSAGGMEGEAGQSVTAWGITVGSKLASGVTKICSNIFSGSPRSSPVAVPPPSPGGHGGGLDGVDCGVVTILDMVDISSGEQTENIDITNTKAEGVVAHFVAHSKAIVAMAWDSSGSLLLTADKLGNNFNLFRVVAHPLGSAFAAVHHLYTLYRGDTPGSVQDIAFSPDSRWVTVSTLRGTTHIFPICPYGGGVGVRTHTSHRVVNKLSRFHRSAGLNENPPTTSSGRSSPSPSLGSSPAPSKHFEFPSGVFLGQPVAYPSPHLPPYPSPTMIQPIAQLRQPYIVTLTSQVTLTSTRKPSHGKRNSVPDDIPIRLAVTFAPSRARVLQGVHAGFPRRPKASDSLFVMANHGQLLEYSLDPVPDQTIAKDKVCESSPIDLNIVAFGQWNLAKSGGKERTEVSPPLDPANPLLISKELLGSQEEPWPEDDSEDRWLSQVEIVTHIGPARRLWMGPQFSFRTFQHMGQSEDDLADMDVTVTTRPQQSEPMQMPGGPNPLQKPPVFIECGSANSFELSPRFANLSIRGSRETVSLDVESELREAMSDTVQKTADEARKLRGGRGSREDDEEFFCLSTEDVRSTPAISEGKRSRNSSEISQPRSRHTSTSSSGMGSVRTMESALRTVEMATAETKIFSVAVSQGKAENSSNMMKNVVMKDVERQPVNRPVTLLPSSRPEIQGVGERPEITPSDDEFKPVQRDVSDAPGCVESLDMTDELESALSQAAETTEKEEEVKKTKKNKKKKNTNNPENNVDSSADDFKEVEVKPKKKKNKKQANVEEKEPEPSPVLQKEKTPEPEAKEKTPENDPAPQPVPRKLKNKKKQELEVEEEKAKKEEEQLTEEFVGFEPEEEKFEGFERSKTPESFIPVESPTVEETATAMFEEFSKRSPPTKDGVSPNRDLVEFSEEESVVRVIEAEEDVEEDEEEDKVEFFIKEKSSSLEPEESNMTSSGIDPMAARPNPWFEKFLKKSSSMIEDQIFGAVKKYEDVEEKGSDEEEGMEELEKNQADTEKNIADLLEDDEDLMMEPKIIASQPPSSNLSQLLKGEGGKKNHVDDSSDDDFMFRPVVQQQKKNKKQKKQKGQVLSLEEFHRSASQPRETDSGSVADSESEKVSDQEGYSTNQGASKDGWSFEVDEEDVNKLLETDPVPVEQPSSEERTDLEDVFRFDSEMHEDEDDLEEVAAPIGDQQGKKSVSVDDLNDALMEETTDESEAEGAAVPIPEKEESVPESSSNAEPVKPILGTSMSSSYASSMDSESSTTNSPNPRSSQSKNKNKKGKKKKK